MNAKREVVLTGLGVVSPIGFGGAEYWQALMNGRTGITRMPAFDQEEFPVRFGGQIVGFDAKLFVTPRKSLKVMSLETQWAFAAARMAADGANLAAGGVDPDRFGVVFGADMSYSDPLDMVAAQHACTVNGRFEFDRWGSHALGEIYPLWLLKYLPNMPACHIAIGHDARGPNNSITLGAVSSLTALTEACRLIERGAADVVITGGTGYQLNNNSWGFRTEDYISHRFEDPEEACRPFDADRDGTVWANGAAAFVLESRGHAEARRATIRARVLGCGSGCEPLRSQPRTGDAIVRSIRLALDDAGLTAADIGHVNAHGMGTVVHDRIEAQAIRRALGTAPVTALQGYFGNAGAASGALQAVASVLALSEGRIPFTRNYRRPDPECPICVVRGEPAPLGKPHAMLLSQSTMGQAVAVAIGGPN